MTALDQWPHREQNKRQRLENEISLRARFRTSLSQHLALGARRGNRTICKAARSVSGDYYDFIQLSPTHVAIAIADISGKGISAALLMASLQAALRKPDAHRWHGTALHR